MGEAYVPAEQPEAGQEPRLQAPDVDPGRAGDHQGPPPEGPAPSHRLIWRIRERDAFVALRRSRRRVRSGPITVTFVAGAPGTPPQVGYAISRKVGGAVVRNRLKRRLRSIVAGPGPTVAPGIYLIGAAPPAASLPFHELRTLVTEGLVAAGGRQA